MIPNKIVIKVIRHKFITLNIHYTKNNNGKYEQISNLLNNFMQRCQ